MEIAKEAWDLYQQYSKDGVKVCGFIGVNGSPSCGVEMTSGFKARPGVFTEELLKYFKQRNNSKGSRH